MQLFSHMERWKLPTVFVSTINHVIGEILLSIADLLNECVTRYNNALLLHIQQAVLLV